VLSMLPSGLLGEVRNTILGLCSATARLMPATASERGGKGQGAQGRVRTGQGRVRTGPRGDAVRSRGHQDK